MELPDKQIPPSQRVEGTVERIVFTNPDNLYTVAAIQLAGSSRELTIVGNLANLHPGDQIKADGEFISDKRYGQQFRVVSFEQVMPSTAVAIEKYLASGRIKGIGKTYAKRLVAKFGTEIFEVIDAEPGRLGEVEGIGPKRADRIIRGWNEHRALREIFLFLQLHSIPPGFAGRIFKTYGEKAIEVMKQNPYQLALDIRGIGFKSADQIAMKLGIPMESIERCKAGVFYLLQNFALDGHCFFPADALIEKASKDLQVSSELIVAGINALKVENHVVLEILPDGTKAVYLRQIHGQETGVCSLLFQLMNTGKLFPKMDPAKELEIFEGQYHFKLAANQRQAISDALGGGVLVITGGPGTGKTTIIKAILRILTKHGITTLLAAPTGRAAKRMQELTHTPASTIHRLLQFSAQDGRYSRNPQNPLRGDFIIIDEASMIDIGLAQSLLRAIAPTSSVIFVGDIDQLPSVGPGNFLRDLIESRAIPVVRLNEVFRQAQQSEIITNAHRINQGLQPVLSKPDDTGKHDFYFLTADDANQVLQSIKDLVHARIPAKYGFDPATDIQVITPMHRGPFGAQNLNKEIQQLLNPSGAVLEAAGNSYRVGDKVMQVENNYDRDVFNGDIGTIASIDREDHLVKVNFDGRIVTYDFNDMDELELAYAITVHKSQGSEYRAVVMPIHTSHYVMLQRNLLYTGITRGRKLVCLVGQQKAVRMAVDNVSAEPRYSALNQRLASVRKVSASPRQI
ncbi:MAG: ATP-dependent RecD-like DNA helicase [Candidatus Sumerlaeaceae bacterium]|nr:ATP-dependent RecD-like DNA helicase [Candidatus Sumerlaeaceae bacterium]